MKTDWIGDSTTFESRSSRVVIGYGNPLRSDDGIGWRIVQELRTRSANSRVAVIACHEPAPEMAERIQHATVVIFVDAAIDGFPGEVRHHRVNGFSVEGSGTAFSHGRTPAALIALARDLYAVSPEAHLFTVSGSSFRYGETLSSEVARVFPSVVSEIEKLLRAADNASRPISHFDLPAHSEQAQRKTFPIVIRRR